MSLLQALDEGRTHELLTDYEAFREAVIGVMNILIGGVTPKIASEGSNKLVQWHHIFPPSMNMWPRPIE